MEIFCKQNQKLLHKIWHEAEIRFFFKKPIFLEETSQ